MKFFHLAKYGSKRDVKTLSYVASRHDRPIRMLGEEEHKLYEVQRCRVLLNTGYFSGKLAVFDWVGDLKQFKPVPEKALEYYVVAKPDWCRKS